MTSSVDEILSRCQLFSQVDPVRRKRLADVSLVRRFAKGIHIFHEGDPCPGVYIVSSGAVRVFKTGPGGKEHVLHMVGAGQTFAEVAAICHDSRALVSSGQGRQSERRYGSLATAWPASSYPAFGNSPTISP